MGRLTRKLNKDPTMQVSTEMPMVKELHIGHSLEEACVLVASDKLLGRSNMNHYMLQ